MQKINFKALLPHLAAVVIFILTIFAYFPELLEGKAISMGDIEQHKGMSSELADYRERTGEEAIWTNSMFGGMPGCLISVFYHGNLLKFVDQILKLGLPRPAGYMFTLMLGFYVLMQILRVNSWVSVIGAIAYCLSSYNLLIIEAGHMSKVDAIAYMPWVVAGVICAFRRNLLIGALLTAIALSLQIKATHYQVTYYMSFFLFFYVLFEVIHFIKEKQISKAIKPVALLVLAGILAILSNISSIYTIYDYGKDSIRGKSELTIKNVKESDGLDRDYALQYSYGIGESFSYMIPDIYGGSSSESLGSDKNAVKDLDNQYAGVVSSLPKYWGDDSSSGPFYAGALVCFLFVLGFFWVKHPIRWAILATVVLAFMLSWGKNFIDLSEFMLNNFPGYNKFRAVKMILILCDFLIPVMAVLTIDQILKNTDQIKANIKTFYWAFALTGGLCLLFWLIPSLFFDLQQLSPSIENYVKNSLQQSGTSPQEITAYLDNLRSNVEPAREYFLKADAMRAFILILIGAALSYFFVLKRFSREIFIVGIGLLIIGDLWLVDKRYVNSKDFVSKRQSEIPFEASASDMAIMQDQLNKNAGLENKINERVSEARKSNKSFGNADVVKYQFRGLMANTHYRVMNLASNTFNDAGTSFFHKSLGGYSAAKLERYQEFIEYHLSKNMQAFSEGIQSVKSDSAMQALMGSLYAFNMLNADYIIYNAKAAPIINNQSLGHAWLVNKINWVKNADEEILAMKAGFNPANEVYIDERFKSTLNDFIPSKTESDKVKLLDYSPNKLVYESNTAKDALAIFSEVYYAKGWLASVDGKPAEHFRANYILRGMKIPAGKHQIVFEFKPQPYIQTEKIAFASSCLLIVLAGVVIFLVFRKTPIVN